MGLKGTQPEGKGMNLNLSLPSYGGERRGNGLLVGLSVVCVVLLAALMVLQLASRGKAVHEQAAKPAAVVDDLKNLALRLEKRSLPEKAARTWLEYIEAAGLAPSEKAQKLEHAAELLQQAGKYDDAIVAYFKADDLKPGPELQPAIDKGLNECFTRLGKYTDAYYESKERTAIGADKVDEGSKVVAEVGPKKVTLQEFERMLDDEMQKIISSVPPEQAEQYRKYYREQFTKPDAKQRKLSEMFSREALTREGREQKVDQSPEFKARIAEIAEQVLAQQVIKNEIGKIKLTDSDYKMFYEARKPQYKEPEKAKISRILMADEKAAQELLATLKTADDFAKAAKEKSTDAKTKDNGGEIDGEVRTGTYVQDVGSSKELNNAIFATKAGDIIDKPYKTSDGFNLVLVREKVAEREKPYDEVKDQVKQDYDRQKQEEVSQAYVESLFKKYNINLYPGVIAGEEKPAAEQPPAAPQPNIQVKPVQKNSAGPAPKIEVKPVPKDDAKPAPKADDKADSKEKGSI